MTRPYTTEQLEAEATEWAGNVPQEAVAQIVVLAIASMLEDGLPLRPYAEMHKICDPNQYLADATDIIELAGVNRIHNLIAISNRCTDLYDQLVPILAPSPRLPTMTEIVFNYAEMVVRNQTVGDVIRACASDDWYIVLDEIVDEARRKWTEFPYDLNSEDDPLGDVIYTQHPQDDIRGWLVDAIVATLQP